MSEEKSKPAQSQGFFAAWLLLHEKADDWLRDAMKRAKDTPEEARKDYQEFLISVDREKELLKGVFADALVNELRHMGFTHSEDSEDLKAEIESLRSRLSGLEEKLERFTSAK